MSGIFISHAVRDKTLADRLVKLLKEGIGVPEKEIFCSSLDGHSIPFGEDFNAYMKDKIKKPDLVILLMTPAYMESHFCLMELGAAWAMSHKALPIVVPPTEFGVVSKTLGLKQAWNITKHAGLIDLRQMVQEIVEVEERTEHTWEKKRTEWKSGLRRVLKKLDGPSHVPSEKHENALAEIEDLQDDVGTLQELLEEEREKVEKLKAAKDADEVDEILEEYKDGEDLEKVFESLLEAVKEARPKHASRTVLKHIIMDFFDKPSEINWYRSDADEFKEAISYGLLSQDAGNQVEWQRDKLNALQKALGEVGAFLAACGKKERKILKNGPDTPMDADDLEFWEYHLDL